MSRTLIRERHDLRSSYRCRDCGVVESKWFGRCPGCGAWGSVDEQASATRSRSQSSGVATAARPIGEATVVDHVPMATRIGEVDRVFSGGLVPGSVTLIGGEPGIGKSTLVLQMLGALAGQQRALLLTGEESEAPVRARAERVGALHEDLWLAAESSLPAIIEHITTVCPRVVAIDSIQTLRDPSSESAAGSVAQVRECSQQLVELAKARGIALVLIGHVTKDGSLAGPRTLEHLVDTVCSFEGDRHTCLRMLRAVKHRFGPTNELGLFEMAESGLIDVADPSQLFLADRAANASGTVVAAVVEGSRSLLVEIQALVSRRETAAPRQSAQGLDQRRMAMLVGVVEQLGSGISRDVFASVAGGLRVEEPAADLAIACAIVSSFHSRPLVSDVAVIGEVGLAGEIRQVPHIVRRVNEAARLGYRRVVVPKSTPDVSGVELHRVQLLGEAFRVLGLHGTTRRST